MSELFKTFDLIFFTWQPVICSANVQLNVNILTGNYVFMIKILIIFHATLTSVFSRRKSLQVIGLGFKQQTLQASTKK